MSTRALPMLTGCLLATAAIAVGGCLAGPRATGTPAASTTTIPVGQSTESLEFAGLARTFHVYRPDGLAGPAPLVVMLHGGYGDGAQAERAYRWDAQADSGHFLVAYPDGVDRAWNAGSCCGHPMRAGVDDVGFLTAMVAAIEQQLPIDPTRVYVTGMSNGAMMALRLGCQTDLFAAIAPVAGTLLADCGQARPTSVLQINGTADDRVPYGGGPGKGLTRAGTPNVNGPPVAAVNATWRAIDSCPTPTSAAAGDVTTETAACPGGRAVELISISGAGHQWPGGVPSPAVEKLAGLPPPSTALNATETIWQFFTEHHR